MIPPFLARNITIPLLRGIRSHREVYRELRKAEKIQWLSQKEIIELQWLHLEKLIHDAYTWVPYYKRKFDEHGINLKQIQSPEDFKKIPILTKEEINVYREEMVSPRYRGKIYINMTGGSTGVPTRFYQVKEHWIKSTAARIKNLRWTGVNEGEKMSIIWGHQIDLNRLNSILEKLKGKLTNSQLIPALSFDNKVIRGSIQAIEKFRPKLIGGYNTYLHVFAQYIRDNQINGIRPKAVISTANTLLDSQRKTIENAFQCKVYNRYGSRELGCIASECSEHNGLHVNVENVFVEFERLSVSGEKDGLFSLICTSLGNYGMPFIRYDIGDLGVPSFESCPCGRGLPMIKKLKGRTHDILLTPAGNIVTGDLFDIIFQEHSHIVRQFQVRQKRLDRFEIFLSLQTGANENDAQFLKNIIENIIGHDVEILIKVVEEIPVSTSGKLHLTISEI